MPSSSRRSSRSDRARPRPGPARDWSRYRADPRVLADAFGHPALLGDSSGHLTHETPALRALLEAEPEAERLRVALSSVLVSRPPRPADVGERPGATLEVRTGEGRYTLRGSGFDCAGPGEPPIVLVTVERREPEPRSKADLREAFSLTEREARVALLLARGLSNADLARELVISPHTARRHTERVLRKLGVRSRAEIASRVLF